MRASQPRLQARHAPLPRERGRSWEHPRAPWPSARSEPEEAKGTILTLTAAGQRRGPVWAAGSAASAEVDASGWEGADRAGGAEPGGSRARIGRALPEIAAGPGRGPESAEGVGGAGGVLWGSAFEAVGIASSGIAAPARSESPGTLRISRRKRSPPLFGKEAFMSFNATTNRRETCEARTTLKTSAHRVLHFETEIKRPRST